MKVPIEKRVRSRRVVVLDGSMGALLMARGIEPGKSVCRWNIERPDVVGDIHRRYVASGAEIILTNTFESNPDHYEPAEFARLVPEAVAIAREAAGNSAYVAGDVGPLGVLIEPFGDFPFDEAYARFAIVARLFAKALPDLIFVESFTSMLEARAAFLALRLVGRPIVVTGSFQNDGRTVCGDTPEAWALSFEKLGALAVGANCTEPETALEMVRRMRQVTNLPLVAKPNAGIPRIVDEETVYSLSAQQLAKFYKEYVAAGATMIGGCCGSTPEYIATICRKKARVGFGKKYRRIYICSSRHVLNLGKDGPTLLVGERLNPSGRKALREALTKGDFEVYGTEACRQEEAGADALDVNAWSPTGNEKKALRQAVLEVYKKSSRPLFIDTQDFAAAEEVLRLYPGIAVLNSIPARSKDLRRWLPLVGRYGARAVISLVGTRLPKDLKDRFANLKVAERELKRAGLGKDDVIIDPLVYAISTDRSAGNTVIEAVKAIRRRGFRTILGVSNVSYGLPSRTFYNAALLTAAVHAGATFVIANPTDEVIRNTVWAARAIYQNWLTESLVFLKPKKEGEAGIKVPAAKRSLAESIIRGESAAAVREARRLLRQGTPPLELVEKDLGNALKVVGEKYEQGEYFLPHLLAAGDAAKSVIDLVKQHLPGNARVRGKVLLATVKGDIHDIGKNIVKTVLVSGGYEVIDLGKDKSKEKIIQAVRKHRPDVLGLSALMTTTMPEMAKVAAEVKRLGLPVKIVIGGAPTDERFARKIGAVAYARDAIAALKVIGQLIKDVPRKN